MSPAAAYARPDAVFERVDPKVGRFTLRPLDLSKDAGLIVDWVRRPYARYWNMADKTEDEVAAFYAALTRSAHAAAYLGERHGAPAFLTEIYDPRHDQVGDHYEASAGDRGMHVLVAPAERQIAGFTLAVMRTIMAFVFDDPAARRVVVEPDIRNDKIHALNRAVGFVYDRPVAFREKTAHLAFCTRAAFEASLAEETAT
ncbi:GNAT family N-acetyltransferase [Hansschlegelia sp. KR7-227]|uniref:GNAT family N-acetyltransferase n=1 Tax=Hansschlegelia sp. KR7-227 TaxID=3400914 RepID=UPI003C03C6FE